MSQSGAWRGEEMLRLGNGVCYELMTDPMLSCVNAQLAHRGFTKSRTILRGVLIASGGGIEGANHVYI